MLRLAIVKYNQKLAIFSVFYLLKLHDIQTQLYLISPHHHSCMLSFYKQTMTLR